MGEKPARPSGDRGQVIRTLPARRRRFRFFPGFLLPVLVSGPVEAGAQRTQDRILAEIRQIQSQLSTLTETQTTLAEAVSALLADRDQQLGEDRRDRAETRNALDRMERDVATLSEAFRQTNDRLSELMVELQSLREAQQRAALAAVESSPEGEPVPTAEDPITAPGADPVPAASTGESPLLGGPSVSEIYLEAQADYVQGRYDLAFSGFEQVAGSDGELADDARYLMGEVLLAQGKPEAALEQFEIVIRDFPESVREAEAWYKKGVILKRLGHESDARDIFEDILEVFPGTQAAHLAQRELNAMPESG